MSKTIINARVDSELSLDHKSIPKSLRWAIAQHFVIKNPELEKRRKIGLDSTHVQRHVNFYRMRSGPTWAKLGKAIAVARVRRISSRDTSVGHASLSR